MADERVVGAVKIVDPTTTSQQAAVDSSGRLSVNLTASAATVTVDTELPAAAALTDNFANPTVPGVGAFGMLWDGATWDRAAGSAADGALVNLGANNDVTVTGSVTVDSELPAAAALSDNFANPTAPAVGAFGMLWDGATWDRAAGSAADGALVNLGANNDVTVTGTVTVDTELAAAGALADATANPTVTSVGAFLQGYNGTTWDRVRTANTGRLQVDVVTGGGADAPTNPVNNYDTTSAVAAGASDNHDTADFGAATKKVSQVLFAASVPLKVELQYLDDGTPTTLAVGFSKAGEVGSMRPPHRNYWSHAFTANAGADLFRLVRTNMDTSEAADVYSTIAYED